MYTRIGARIKKAREYKYLSQSELGAKLGVTATAINYYEKGKRKIGIDDLYRLAAALNKPFEYFLSDGISNAARRGKRAPGKEFDAVYDLTSIPVLGLINAGEPALSQQNVIGHLPVPHDLAESVTFALRVKGDSMVGAGISEGDMVLIRRQPYADFNGQIICALVDGENTLKYILKDNEIIILRAANPNHPDIVIKNERALSIQGVFAGVFKLPLKAKPV